MVDAHRERYGRLDVPVTNAGLGVGAPVDELRTKAVDLQLDLNLRSVVLFWHARAHRGEVALRLEATGKLPVPGLAGIALETAAGTSLALERATGGLRARRRVRDGPERLWTVLGASRGEPGILGDGIRHALLNDRSYPEALQAARAMV